ncbi:RHS repeat-associated core domain-containing protein, partial [Chryseobacterium sp. EO14]|uniref:RHS repeat-associated core domain-containing protein n=1 Tax=Chryseobacterium sp. EO14 TaxID=2950551 RepID=UPI00210DBB3A
VIAKAKGQWFFTKYDKLGRVLYTGITSGGERADEQTNVYTKGLNNEERTSAVSFTQNSMPVYYTNSSAYPVTIQQILSVNYYDTYPEGTPQISSTVLNQEVLSQDPTNNLVSTKGLAVASYTKNIEDDNWTKNYIWYDSKGRSIATHSINHLGGYTKTESKLDFAGVVQQTKAYHKRLSTDTEKVIVQNFEYDSLNRLKKQWHQVDSNPQELLVENTYNELSQLSNKKVGNNLQSIDYTYNIKGAVIKINDPANLNGKLFGYEIKNTNPESTAAKFNGSITEVDWRTSTDNVLRRYSYEYDPLNRLKNGKYSEPNSSIPQNDFYNEIVTYDVNSNILSLQRSSKNLSGAKELVDDLSYNYTGNKLNSVTDISLNYAGYPETSGNTISYDDNGNMTNQIDKGILQIDYNFLDLPKYIKFNEYVSVDRKNKVYVNTTYQYSAGGTKLRKIHNYKDVYQPNALGTKTTDYLDGFQYEYDWNPMGGIPTNDFLLKFVPTSEGYYNFENNKYIYSYTDHLGNIRVSYFKNQNGSAEVLEENNYYPFGLKHENYNTFVGNPSYSYGYNGKELQKETGWSDYGARMYMSDIGRWGVIDPLAETSRRFTPYNYALNNPVMFIDPDGRKAAAPQAPMESLTPTAGLMEYYGNGGSGVSANLFEFLGLNDQLSSILPVLGNGG